MELHVFQKWGHLSTSLVSEVYFVICKTSYEVKFVQILGMLEVLLEWMKCGMWWNRKCIHAVVFLNRWFEGVLNAIIFLQSNLIVFQ